MTEEDKKSTINEIYAHLRGIKNNIDRMTSGNYMHNTASIKLSVDIIEQRLQKIGLYEKE